MLFYVLFLDTSTTILLMLRFLPVDHTKFGKRNLIKYNDVSEYDKIFTDEEADYQTRQEIAKAGGHLLICD